MMVKSGTNPSKTTFINLLSGCSHLGLVEEDRWYYDHMMDEFGVEPETEHQCAWSTCLVGLGGSMRLMNLGRSGRLDEAYEFIKQMRKQPDPGVWGALLSACNYHGDLEMGREVAEILFVLEPENFEYFLSLFNMYAGAGRRSDAAELRRKIQDKEASRLQSC